jgi:hypothetical protein
MFFAIYRKKTQKSDNHLNEKKVKFSDQIQINNESENEFSPDEQIEDKQEMEEFNESDEDIPEDDFDGSDDSTEDNNQFNENKV